MAYGKGFFKRRSSFRSGRGSNRYRNTTRNAVAYRAKRTIARRLNRKEIKYIDESRRTNAWDRDIVAGLTNNNQVQLPSYYDFWLSGIIDVVRGGSMYTRVQDSGNTIFGATPEWQVRSNCVSRIEVGPSVTERIGNKINPRYLVLNGIVTAASLQVLAGAGRFQDGETSDMRNVNTPTDGNNTPRFCRTAIKIVVVRDKNKNPDGFVQWEDVYKENIDMPRMTWNRNLNNISRFEILKEMVINLDSDDPQKSFRCVVPLKGKVITYSEQVVPKVVKLAAETELLTTVGGTVPVTNSATNIGSYKTNQNFSCMENGIYILMAGATLGGSNYNLISTVDYTPEMVYSTRLSFYDP